MVIEKIELSYFRNYNTCEIAFDSGLNIICGNNAQGKTNLLEAVYFCVVGKSFRAKKEKEVIGYDKDIAKIKIFVKKEIGQSIVEIIFSKNDKKTIKINNIPIKKASELLGEFNGVFFSPDELKLIKESPEDRRRFMDIDISQTSKQYLYAITRYKEILDNRNRLLKEKIERHDLENVMQIWNDQLASCALKIATFRKNFVLSLEPYAKKAHSYITDGKEELSLEYVGIKEQTKEEIISVLEKNLDKDLSLGFTSYGPHRDDIKVVVNGLDIRVYGSQGQQRTCALSLKLAELDIIENLLHTKPVLLLDDVLSELDGDRKQRLLDYCMNNQTLITCTDFEYNVKHKKITIEGGKQI